MADVFISYSRRDESFVERLREALAQRDKDVWLDREDIGPAVEWRRELELGIEGADVFAFVISPDALRSEPCRHELEHAVAKQKRILPLLRREPEGLAVPEALASRNYIFVRTDDEFEPGCLALLAAIEGLPEWARDHTRLLQRAEEWESRDRDASFLLRGSDLSDAERWLSKQGAHSEPTPTSLQIEYLLASRKAATRRQRLTVGASVLALAVSLVLALVALLQRNEAQDQRDEAVRQAQLATSRELAARSGAAVRTDPWQALRLAVEAAETSATPESTDALRRALQAPREKVVLELPDAAIRSARFADDSAHVLTRSKGGRAQRWNLKSAEYTPLVERSEFRDTSLCLFCPNGPRGRRSKDGALRLAARRGGVRITDAATGTQLIGLNQPSPGFEGTILGADFSPDGRSFLTVSYDGKARIWPLGFRLLAKGELVGGAISADGANCLTAAGGATLTMWSCATGERLWNGRLPAGPYGVDDAYFAAGGEQVIIATGSTTAVLDAGTGDAILQLEGSRSRGSPSVNPTGSLALRPQSSRRSEIVDLPDEAPIATLDVGLSFGGAAWAEDARRLAIHDARRDSVFIFDSQSDSDPTEVVPLDAGGVMDLQRPSIDLSTDGSMLLTSGGAAVERWDADTGDRVGMITTADLVTTTSFSDDERFLVTGENVGRASVWETASGRPVAVFPVPGVRTADASLSEDGHLLAVGFAGPALVFDCVACAQPPELLAEARAELESRPASSASPAGP